MTPDEIWIKSHQTWAHDADISVAKLNNARRITTEPNPFLKSIDPVTVDWLGLHQVGCEDAALFVVPPPPTAEHPFDAFVRKVELDAAPSNATEENELRKVFGQEPVRDAATIALDEKFAARLNNLFPGTVPTAAPTSDDGIDWLGKLAELHASRTNRSDNDGGPLAKGAIQSRLRSLLAKVRHQATEAGVDVDFTRIEGMINCYDVDGYAELVEAALEKIHEAIGRTFAKQAA